MSEDQNQSYELPRIFGWDACAAIQPLIQESIQEKRAIILDLGKVTQCSTAGAQFLVCLQQTCFKQNVELDVRNPGVELDEVFQDLGLSVLERQIIMQDDDLRELRKAYFEEGYELLTKAEAYLNSLQDDPEDTESINGLFRCIHSIKGGAGVFGFTLQVKFAHKYETLMDLLRSHQRQMTPDIIATLFRANDVMYVLMKADEHETGEVPIHMQETLDKIEAYIKSDTGGEAPPISEASFKESQHLGQATESPPSPESAPTSSLNNFLVRFVPNADMMRFGNDPLLILRQLKTLAMDNKFVAKIDKSKLPDFEKLNVQDCYLSWQIEMSTLASKENVLEAFEFAQFECSVEIERIDISLTEKVPAAGVTAPVSPKAADPQVQETSVLCETSEKLTDKSPPAAKPKSITNDDQGGTLRVDLSRIDHLVNTVGEIVIKQAMVMDSVSEVNIPNSEQEDMLMKGLQQLNQHMRELQESVMAIRAQPIKTVFSRMPRLVRELSSELDKEVQLLSLGENTEIDKTVVERLGEPLMHMIRNAIDHGIEGPEERVAAGKVRHGTITLSAEHRGGRFAIEIKDDGRGINRQRVLNKAIEKGLIPDSVTLNDNEINNLIFLPGFSTASSVTNISGRGVGMDVVKRSIEELGGRVMLTSQEGQGSCFTLMLPLTLAVLDGMLVSVGDQIYIIPLLSIVETMQPQQSQAHHRIGPSDVIHIRGEDLVLLRLQDLFEIKASPPQNNESIVVIVETDKNEKLGLIVDRIIGQQQVVIKSIEANYQQIPGISASTILGNGRVALILDVSGLKELSQQEPISYQQKQ